ncbi:hypothetical protein AB8A05_14675 [Tardiphaga sp. 538_B7_N1_4]|uniref:hypothetical protein n=1 Tax=Tardiphaga sp. 538_B7_N1_4 TaxID=3240778 RepID=UPI003F2734B8
MRDPQEAFEFIGKYVAYQIGQGVVSPLLLSNQAIAAYERHREKTPLRLVEYE